MKRFYRRTYNTKDVRMILLERDYSSEWCKTQDLTYPYRDILCSTCKHSNVCDLYSQYSLVLR